MIFIRLLGWLFTGVFGFLAIISVFLDFLGLTWVGYAMMACAVHPSINSNATRRVASFFIAFLACGILVIGSTANQVIGVILALFSCAVLIDFKQKKKRESESKSAVLAPEVAQFVSLCEAVLADELVHQNEAEYLMDWLAKNPVATDESNIYDIYNLLKISLEDGYLDESEAEELRLVLSEFCDRILNKSQPLPKPKKTHSKKTIGPAHGGFLIHYEDAKGNVSEREINVRAITDKNGVTYLKAYCHARRAMRTFRLDRVVEVIDLGTGEVIDARKFVGALH